MLEALRQSQTSPHYPVPSRPAPAVAAHTASIQWVEPDKSFLRLSLRNLLLTIATLGIYHFWGAAESRRRLYAAIRINGAPLSYAANGRDAFIAFASALLLIASITGIALLASPADVISALAPSQAFAATATPAAPASPVTTWLSGDYRYLRLSLTLPLLFLLGSIAYRSHRSYLARLAWSGKSFTLAGNPWHYAWTNFWTAFTVPLTLGWAAPWRAMKLQRLKTEHTHIGTEQLRYSGELRPRYKAFASFWAGGIAAYVATNFTLGLVIGDPIISALEQLSLAPLAQPGVAQKGILIIAMGLLPLSLLAAAYRADILSRDVSAIRIGATTLALDLPRWQFARLATGGRILKIASLGALAPVVDARLARFVLTRVTMDAPPETSSSENLEISKAA